MTPARCARAGRGQAGQVSVELLGMLPWLLLAALVVWQILLAAYTAVSASNAARVASRVESRGGDAERAGVLALPGALESGAEVEVDGEQVAVRARVPIVIPGIASDRIAIEKEATMPGGG
jgi:hypothetical protein